MLWFITWIIQNISRIAGTFYDVYVETSSWIWPFNYVSNIFYYGYIAADNLAYYFGYFGDWCNDVWNRVLNILSWDNIVNLIRSWLSNIEQVVYWFFNWWNNVLDVINQWWSTIQDTIKSWIDTAIRYLQVGYQQITNFLNYIWPSFENLLNSITSEWQSFRDTTLSSLVTFHFLTSWLNSYSITVQNLINSTLNSWFPFYGDMVLFFSNPVQFLWERFTDWFFKN